jgi:hypothetical protein
MGIVQAVLTLIGIKFFIDQYSRESSKASTITKLLFFMGTFPFLLTLNRPEQTLFLLFLGLTYLSKKVLEIESRTAKILARTVQTLILVSMPAIHPKGALLSIMALSIAVFLGWNKSKRLLIPEVGMTLISVWESAKIWNLRTLCPESNFMTETFKIITLNPTKLDLSTPQMVLGNLIRTPKYLLHMFYQQDYQSSWLAQSKPIPTVISIIGNLAILGFFLFLSRSLFNNFVIKTLKSRNLDLSNFTAGVLLSGCIALVLLQRTKNFYDTYLVVLLFVLAVAITYESKSKHELKLKMLAVLTIGFLIIPALFSTLIKIAPDKQNDYKAISSRIVSECGITSQQISDGNFILDPSLTRFFWNSPRFIYSSYVWGWWAQDVNAKELIEDISPSVIIIRNENFLEPEPGDKVVGDFYCRNLMRLKK